MARPPLKVISSGVDDKGNRKLRILLNLNKDRAERYDLAEGVEVELVDRADGILVRRRK